MKFGNKFLNLEGKIFTELTVVKVHSKDKYGRYVWECLCSCGKVKNVSSRSLVNRYSTSCGCSLIKGNLYYNNGLYAIGKYKTSLNGIQTKEFKLWISMLRRCYDQKVITLQPTYKGCEVSENFKIFQYFAEWCNNQKGFKNESWDLDKDIIGNGKLYSEDTCCFVPRKINCQFRKLNTKMVYKKTNGKFTSSCCDKYLGTFDSEESAYNAYSVERKAVIRLLINEYEDIIDFGVVSKLEELCI